MNSKLQSYHWITKSLHWLIAFHMIGLIAFGWWMIDLSFYSTWYHLAPMLHKTFGVLVFVLGIILLVWQRIKPRPEPLSNHKKFEKFASKIAHVILATSVIIIPISGYIFTTANGEGIELFDLVTLPALFEISDGLRDIAINVHIYASYGLLVVIAAHAGGAFKHHLIDKDRTLRRMTF